MRLLFLLGLWLAASTSAWAQNLYSFSQSTRTYTPITGGTVAGTATAGSNFSLDDVNYTLAAGAIPFTFTYNGIGYTGLRINSNGYITFGTTAPSVSGYTPLSATTAYAGAASAIGQDLVGGAVAGSLGEVRYETVGTAPNRSFVVQYTNFKRYVSAIQDDNLNFQIRLNETSNTIDFVYNLTTVAATASGLPQVGVRGASSAAYANRTTTTDWSASAAGASNTATMTLSNTVRPASGLTYTFTPPACSSPSAVAAGSVTGTSAAVTFTASASASSYTVTYTPAGGAATTVSPNPTASPVALTGLTPGTAYTVSIVSNCAGGTTSAAVTAAFTTLAPPPANNECTGAISLSSDATCAPVTGSTIGATQSLAAIGCGGFTGNADDDVWYSFVATNVQHTVRVTGNSSFDAVVDVRSGTCASSTNIGCADAEISGGTETVVLPGLTIGSTYYVRVYTYSGTAPTTTASGGFTICVTNPANVPCAQVTNAAVTAATTTGQLTFTAAAGATNYTLTLAPTAGGSTTTAVLSGSPVNLSGLIANTAYTITISTNCSNGGVSSPVVVNFTTTAPVPAPANDECAGAISLNSAVTCTPTSGSTAGATASTAAGTCDGTADDDVWYSFVATNTSHTITVAGAAGFDAVVNLRSGACPGTNVGSCLDAAASGGTETLAATGLTVGATYLVRVFDYFTGSGSGSFTICITEPAACAAPTAVAVGTIASTSASVSFSAGNGNTSYTVTATPTTGSAITATGSASPVALTGLSASTQYSVTVTGSCAGGQTATSAPAVTFSTLAPPPANDECVGAVALTPGAAGAVCSAVSGTTAGATTSTAAGTCDGTADDDVWYSFVATNTSHTITVAGAAGFDAVVNLRSGACPGTNVGSCLDAAASGGTETLAATGLTVGATYLVRVFHYFTGSGSGNFTICVTTPAAPVCNAPTALATNSVTSTSATVTFTASASASSYIVTYTPAGGTATTVSPNPTASPVALTGLTPNTVYSVSVVSNCAGGATSSAATTSFTTQAAALQDLTVSSVQDVQGTYSSVTITSTGVATLTGPLTVNGVLTVQSGGALAQNCQPINGPGSFVLEAGAELRICDVAGIAATGGTGAVQVNGTRTFSSDANYVYNGTAPQSAGPGLPARVRNLTVANASGLRLTQALNVAEVVRLTSGNLTLNSNALTLLSSAAGTALVDNTGGVVVGQATVQRYIDPSLNSGLGYRHYSSPVFSTTVADLTTAGFSPVVNNDYNISAAPLAVSPFPTVFSYEQARMATNNGAGLTDFDKGWVSPNSTGELMAVGRGYTVNIAASALVDFVGSLNTGSISTLPLARGAQSEAGWHLVGNPYPSPLDWSTVSVPAGLNSAIYVHQSPSQYGTSYRSYQNGVGGNPLIASGQGFFVRTSTAGATPVLTFANANRVTTYGPQVSFNRGPETRPLLQLAVRAASGPALDDTYVYFEAGATAGTDDRFDAYKLPNTTANLATMAGTERLSINGLAPLNGPEVMVPLQLSVPQAGTYTLQATQLLNFGTQADVLLRDAQTGVLHNLRLQPDYTFTLGSISAGTRFALVFRGTSVLGAGAAKLAAQVAVFPNPAQHRFQLTMPAGIGGKTVQATLLNSLGQIVEERTLPVTATGVQAQFDVRALAQGVYVLRLQTASGPVTKRVTVGQ